MSGTELPAGARPKQPVDDPEQAERLTSVCPECGGVLTEELEAAMPQWECHVGHRYSPASLADAQGARVEMALWTAVRASRDRGALLERLAEQAESRGGRHWEARGQAELVLDALNQAAATTLRDVVNGESAAETDVASSR